MSWRYATSLVPQPSRDNSAASPALAVSVVIPTLNEEASLRRNLAAVLAAADEVVVSDGGSGDRSAAVAAELGAQVVSGPAGRGAQLNRGAAAATAPILLFLHADTTLPAGGVDLVRAAIAAGAVGGGFFARFDVDRPLHRLGGWLINRRTEITRVPLGDQAQYATRRAFDALGGYRPWPILEDLDFARRLKRHGRVTMLPAPVTTAARRFVEGGVLRTVATNWLIWALFFVGVSPERLARLYREIR
jgi:rSAM/selenodomain-associated transferase 2